ncbi:MAG: putative zinc-binding metallopeptidase [Pseudomonadota bacterium]
MLRTKCRLTLSLLILASASVAADASSNGDEYASYCKQRVRMSICMVSPMRRLLRRSDVLQRRCLPLEEKFTASILDTYQRLPPVLQQRMCKLDRIFIERSFWASGYAHPRTNTIGLHQRMFNEQKALSDWATWKEQLPFRVKDVAQLITAGQPIHLPRIMVNAPGGQVSSVFFIVVHELAHRIDMDRILTRSRDSQFNKIGWRLTKQYFQSAHLPPSWTVPCFYRCDDRKLALPDIHNVYQSLKQGGFVSLYASRHPSEDFAETMTYYVMSQQPDLEFELHVGNTKVFDLKTLQASKLIQAKFDYMRDLLAGNS